MKVAHSKFIVVALIIFSYLASSFAQTASLPLKSTISVKETPSTIPAPTPKPGSKCKLAHKLITFSPTIHLGVDAQDGTLVWRFYVGIRNPNGKGVKLVSENALDSGQPVSVPSVVADAKEWQCSCCRFLNREHPRLIGWYATLSKDGKVIAEAKSMTGSTEMAKLMEQKPEVPKSREDFGLSLRWRSPRAASRENRRLAPAFFPRSFPGSSIPSRIRQMGKLERRERWRGDCFLFLHAGFAQGPFGPCS